MNEIKRRMFSGETGILLIVPEQYSHDAERQLCLVCGDRLSLHAETLSITRLCNNVFTETGGVSGRILDGGSRILVMHRALESVAPDLKVFGIKKQRTEIIERLLEAVKEFKSLEITPQTLGRIADKASNPLADKLRDLSLIYEAYNSLLCVHGGDAAERLTLLADKIGESSVGNTGHVYFDGFNDFTAQELRVIEELVCKNAKISVCLTCDAGSFRDNSDSINESLSDESEVFAIPHRTAGQLRRLADKYGIPVTTKILETKSVKKSRELVFLEEQLFNDAPEVYSGSCDDVAICSAQTEFAECEYAAHKVMELVRKGYRWRDIGVMARDWSRYGSICENVFDRYDVPYFSSGGADILNKPPAALIDAALDIVSSGWEYKSVFRYLKTGLSDITYDECAELENYVLKWNIRGSLWTREWILPPSGYGGGGDDDTELLQKINELRLRVTEPLVRLHDRIKGVSAAGNKLQGLFFFLEDIKLPQHLALKADTLDKRGETRLADEYVQLWRIITNAMEQMHTILGDTELNAIEFRRLFTLVLSQYKVGVIPVSLDRTMLGGMAMSRRRDLKCLIILGATDENMPALTKSGGALSDSERMEIGKLGAAVPAGLEERLCREMNTLYSTITLPSEKLTVLYPSGGGERPSFIIKRLKTMFGIIEEIVRDDVITAPSDRLPVSPPSRGKLSSGAAEMLYGTGILLSATRVDRFYSCRYKYFLQNGLRLEPRIPVEFDAPAAGIFMHYVLENVSREIKATVGFKNTDVMLCRKLTQRYIEEYVNEVLLNFEGKNARFIYLFRRLEEDVKRVVLDMLEELKHSDFEPLDFELSLSELSDTQRGFIDRVDGYSRDGRMYLRVIDYKTRKKAYSFSLSDVIYGRDLQMLIYLSVLKEFGSTRYGRHIEPAGVLYIPVRDVILKAPRNATEEDISKQRTEDMRRSGLVLDDPVILEAMEKGEIKRFLPVKNDTKSGGFTGDGLVNAKQVEMITNYVKHLQSLATKEILDGDIECDPYYKGDSDNACLYCEYHTVCCFDETTGDKRRFIRKLKPSEIWDTMEQLSKNGKRSGSAAEVRN